MRYRDFDLVVKSVKPRPSGDVHVDFALQRDGEDYFTRLESLKPNYTQEDLEKAIEHELARDIHLRYLSLANLGVECLEQDPAMNQIMCNGGSPDLRKAYTKLWEEKTALYRQLEAKNKEIQDMILAHQDKINALDTRQHMQRIADSLGAIVEEQDGLMVVSDENNYIAMSN